MQFLSASPDKLTIGPDKGNYAFVFSGPNGPYSSSAELTVANPPSRHYEKARAAYETGDPDQVREALGFIFASATRDGVTVIYPDITYGTGRPHEVNTDGTVPGPPAIFAGDQNIFGAIIAETALPEHQAA